jgi:chorismate mutase
MSDYSPDIYYPENEIDRLRADLATLKAERDAFAAEVAALKAAANPLAKRKVVQLIVLPQKGQTENEAYALCDDGTMWRRHEPQWWSQTLNVPQPEQEGKR